MVALVLSTLFRLAPALRSAAGTSLSRVVYSGRGILSTEATLAQCREEALGPAPCIRVRRRCRADLVQRPTRLRRSDASFGVQRFD